MRSVFLTCLWILLAGAALRSCSLESQKPLWFLLDYSSLPQNLQKSSVLKQRTDWLLKITHSELNEVLKKGIASNRLVVEASDYQTQVGWPEDVWVLPWAGPDAREYHYAPLESAPQGLVYELGRYPRLSPVEVLGMRFHWVHRIFEDENMVDFEAIHRRWVRAVRERGIQILQVESQWVAEGWPEWIEGFEKALQRPRGQVLSPSSFPPFEGWRWFLFQLGLLGLGFLLHPVYWLLGVFWVYEYPLSLQLQGFMFALVSVLYLSLFVFKPALEAGVPVFRRVWPKLYVSILSLASLYYFALDTPGFEQRVFLPRGVKLSLILGPLLVLALLGVETVQKYGRHTLSRMHLSPRSLAAFILLASASMAFLILRSGNQAILPPSEAELWLRHTLEQWLLARPRTRELVFWLGLFLGIFASPLLRFLAVLCSALLFSSIFNTFSHFHTPYWVSFMRLTYAFLFASLMWAVLGLRTSGQRTGRTFLGYFGFANLGDDLLLQAALQKYPNATYFCGPQNFDEQRALPRSLAFIWRHLKHLKVLCVGPGGVLQDSSSRLSFAWYGTVICMARLRGVQIEFRGVGFSPLQSRLSRSLLPLLLKNSRIEVRDRESRELLHHYGITEPIEVTEDWVLKFMQEGFQNHLKGDQLGVVLRSTPELDCLQFLSHLQSRLPKQSVILILFEDEPELLQQVQERGLGCELRVYPRTCTTVSEMYAGLRAVVSMRYHGVVLACSQELPVCTLAYDAKCENLARQLNLDCIVSTEEMHLNSIWRRKLDQFIATNWKELRSR